MWVKAPEAQPVASRHVARQRATIMWCSSLANSSTPKAWKGQKNNCIDLWSTSWQCCCIRLVKLAIDRWQVISCLFLKETHILLGNMPWVRKFALSMYEVIQNNDLEQVFTSTVHRSPVLSCVFSRGLRHGSRSVDTHHSSSGRWAHLLRSYGTISSTKL